MSSDWTAYKLGDLCETVTKGTTPTSVGGKFSSSGINFIKVESIETDGRFIPEKFAHIDVTSDELLKRSRLRSGDILFTIAGTIGRVAVVEKSILPANTNQAVAIIRVKQNAPVLPEFVELCLRSPQLLAEVGGGVVGGVQANYSLTNIKALELRAPTLPEQQRICSVISALQNSVRNLRHQNTTLEAIAQRLFRSWFVNFDPVHAKAAGKEPEAMSAELASLFPSEFEDSELGPIPKGWQIEKLGEVCSYLNRGISPKYLEGVAGGVLVLNQKCIRGFSVDFTKSRKHDPLQRKINGRELAVGDVLVNSTGVGTLGRIAQVFHLPEVAIVDSHVTVARVNSRLNWAYFGQFMTNKQPDIAAMGEGSTGQTELSKASLASINIIVPSEKLLTAFEGIVKPLMHQKASNEMITTTLADLRDHLLPRLISGKLSLEEAEQAVEAAM